MASPNPLYRYVGRKRYELKDHLGNVRVVIGDAKNTDGSALLHSYASYFAFGMELPGGSWRGSGLWFFQKNLINSSKVNVETSSVKAVRKVVNGGENRGDIAQQYYNKAKSVFLSR